ncbi:MAG: hypothetical protein IPJ30_01735 [Acidobacteria bacterium]|nr:hypothetical protein [Acidobacteriota bacterium]
MRKKLMHSMIAMLAFVSVAIAAIAGSLDRRFDTDGRLIAVNGSIQNFGAGSDQLVPAAFLQ